MLELHTISLISPPTYLGYVPHIDVQYIEKTTKIHNSIEHLHTDFNNFLLISRHWNYPRKLEAGLPLLEGSREGAMPQPLVMVSAIDIVLPETQEEKQSEE